MTTGQTQNRMKSVTLAELYKKGVFSNISRLRRNSSGYYFITLLKSKGDKTLANNVYFGRKTSEIIEGTFQVGDAMGQFLKHGELVETTNKENETRFKISTSGASNYQNEAELNEIWGNSDNKSDLDLKAFEAEFSSVEAVSVPQES